MPFHYEGSNKYKYNLIVGKQIKNKSNMKHGDVVYYFTSTYFVENVTCKMNTKM